MKLLELFTQLLGLQTLDEQDEFIIEMANFLADVTDLPANIVLWTKSEPTELPHNKYRMKVFKNRIHCATYLIGQSPIPIWETNRKKLKLDPQEAAEVENVISMFSSLFIQYIDDILPADRVKQEIKKLKG